MTPAMGTVNLALAPKRAFLAAFLLTANMELAETAVAESIQALDPSDLTSEALDVLAMRIAKQLHDEMPEPGDNISTQLLQRLPVELHNVLRLPTMLRQCFVLRVLHGLRPELCASLLGISLPQLGIRTGDAAVELARMMPAATAFERHPCAVD